MVQVLVLVFLLLVVLDAVLVSYLIRQRSVAQPRTRLTGYHYNAIANPTDATTTHRPRRALQGMPLEHISQAAL